MAITKRNIFVGAATLSWLCLAGSLAHAQQFNRVIAFGDSLTDQGNVAAASGGAVPNYVPLGLSLQQFSNGPTGITQLFGPSTNFFTTVNPNVGNVNFAFGGAQTVAATALQPVSLQTQINSYVGRGGLFGANDVVSLWGGANNIFDTLSALQTTVPAPSQAVALGTLQAATTQAATDIGNQIRQLSTLGARTLVVFNLPDFAALPQFNPSPATAQPAGFASFNFNQVLQAQVVAAAAASPNVNVVQIPVDAIFAAIIANPASFGFANVTQGCVLTASCLTNPASFNSFLFFDGVHPTQAGHALIAATVQQYLIAPSRTAVVGQTLSDTAFALRRSAVIDATDQLARLAPAQDHWQFFIHGTGEAGGSSAPRANGILTSSGTSVGALNDYTTGGVRLGGLRNIGHGLTVGAAVYFSTGGLDGGARLADGTRQIGATATQIGGDLLARWDAGHGVFVNIAGGANFDRYDQYALRTIGPLRNTANPTGYSASVLGELGRDYKFGDFTLSPKGRFQYLRSAVDAFTETGVVAPVAYSARAVDGVSGAFELNGSYALTKEATLRALIGYEDFLTGSADSARGRLVNNTAQAFSTPVRDPVGVGVVFGGGFDFAFGTVVARANYRGTVGESNQVRHQGTLGASFKF